MKKLLTILLLTAAINSGAQNIWRAPSVFEQPVNFKAAISQTSGTDSLEIATVGANTTLNHGNGSLVLNNTKAIIGIIDSASYRASAGTNNIQLQQGSTDSIIITFSGDTAHLNATVAAWNFNPPLNASSVTGFWKTTGNSGTTAGANFVGTTDSVALFLQALKSFVALGFPTQNRGVFVGNIPYLGDTAFFSSLLNYIINADNNFTVTASNNVNLNATNELNLASNSRTTISVNDSTYIVIDDTSINVKTISGTTEAGYFHRMNRETGNCFSNIYAGKLDSTGLIRDLLRVAVTLNKADYSQSNAHIYVSTDYNNPVDHNGVDVYPTYAQMAVNKTDDAQATGNSLTLDSIGKLNFWSSGSNKFSIDTNGLVSYNELDSATIYALTPTKNATVYCNNCTGNGITGRIVAYIGAAWRRLLFD